MGNQSHMGPTEWPKSVLAEFACRRVAAEAIPEGSEAGKRELEMASHHLQVLGKVPRYISALHLSQGKGVSAGAMTSLHASAF